jgi:hypothetical protein
MKTAHCFCVLVEQKRQYGVSHRLPRKKKFLFFSFNLLRNDPQWHWGHEDRSVRDKRRCFNVLSIVFCFQNKQLQLVAGVPEVSASPWLSVSWPANILRSVGIQYWSSHKILFVLTYPDARCAWESVILEATFEGVVVLEWWEKSLGHPSKTPSPVPSCL